MCSNTVVAYCLLIFLTLLLRNANGISCYQCESTDHVNPYQCSEYMTDADIAPQSCENIFGAQYCVKHTGRIEAQGLECYRCSSPYNIGCSDLLIHDGPLSPLPCDDIYGASYCIKTTGVYEGGLGTKRFCSPYDLGNYCNYIQQPGDQLEYRSCVYTCSTDGCNTGSSLSQLSPVLVLIFSILLSRIHIFALLS